MSELGRSPRASWWLLVSCIGVLCSGVSWIVAPKLHAQSQAQPQSQPQAQREPEVSLNDLLQYAAQHAPGLRLSAQRRAYADAARDGADVVLPGNPSVEFGIGPRFNGSAAQALDFYASLSQPFEIAGERGLRQTAAARLGTRLDAEIVAARRAVHYDVVQAYRKAVIARQRAAASNEALVFAQQLSMIAQRRLAAGDINAIDVRIAELEVATARHQSLLADQALRNARTVLADISGWNVEQPPQVHPTLPALMQVPTLDAVLAMAGDQHPALIAQRAAVDQARAEATLADRQVWAKPTLGVQVAREGSAGSPANYIVLGVVGMALPFWDRNQAERARHRVDAEVAQTQASIMSRALHVQMVAAHAELVAAAERVALFDGGVTPLLNESLTLLQRGFDAGELALLNVASARDRFLRAQIDRLGAYDDYYRALTALERAVGQALQSQANTDNQAGAP